MTTYSTIDFTIDELRENLRAEVNQLCRKFPQHEQALRSSLYRVKGMHTFKIHPDKLNEQAKRDLSEYLLK
jgi:hypothetical protein